MWARLTRECADAELPAFIIIRGARTREAAARERGKMGSIEREERSASFERLLQARAAEWNWRCMCVRSCVLEVLDYVVRSTDLHSRESFSEKRLIGGWPWVSLTAAMNDLDKVEIPFYVLYTYISLIQNKL